ncbi:MAG: glucose-6-phosphate dehydrogenase assembly protein OpcA [Simkaniaceae bacterium]
MIKQPIHPSKIESQLVKILDDLQGTNKMRACLFNLIIYAKNDGRKAYLEEVAQKVIEKFPSRIIMVISDEQNKGNYLNTSVSVLTAESGQNQIFCDLITVEFSGSHEVRVPFVVLPHILPDLPVYILWGEDPQKKSPFWLQIESFVNRLIFDSESTDDLPAFAHSLLEYTGKCRCDIADLNWARIESWRKLLAANFHTQEKLLNLQKVSVIHIHYNSKKTESFCHTKIQALYLQAWLACQLNWKFKESKRMEDQLSFIYQKESSEVQIILHPQEAAKIKPGRILSIEMDTEDETHYTFKRSQESPSHIFIESSTPQSCEIPTHFIFDTEESGQSLVKEIFHKGTNEHFVKVLKFIKQINEKVCE